MFIFERRRRPRWYLMMTMMMMMMKGFMWVFSQSTYNVTSQAKPIFFRNIGHFRNRRVESINNSSVWPPPSIHLVTRRGAMLSVGKASINFSNRSKPFRFYLFLSILLLNRWDEGLGETEVHKKKWKSGLKNSSRS